LKIKEFYILNLHNKLINNIKFQGPEPFSKFMVPKNWFWNHFYKFRVLKMVLELFFFTNLGFQRSSTGTLLSNLGFRPEPVPETLQRLGLLSVPELVPVCVGPEHISKFRVPRNRFWNPFYNLAGCIPTWKTGK
jgi:hypothetical protein